jgi:hypothetical protein
LAGQKFIDFSQGWGKTVLFVMSRDDNGEEGERHGFERSFYAVRFLKDRRAFQVIAIGGGRRDKQYFLPCRTGNLDRRADIEGARHSFNPLPDHHLPA